MDELTKLILMLSPLILINYAIVIYVVFDIIKEDRKVKGLNKIGWILVVLLGSLLGWVLYLLVGKDE